MNRHETFNAGSIEAANRNEVLPHSSTLIVLMRHGQAWHNVPGYGGTINPELTDLGKVQAVATGKYFKKLGMRFSKVITSGMTRADQTAQSVMEVMGLPDTVLDRDVGFRERNDGINPAVLGGRTEDTVRRLKQQFKQLPDERRWTHVPTDVEGIDIQLYETWQHAAERYQKALLDTATKYPGGSVLVVGHAMGILAYLASVKQQMREDVIKEGRSEVYPNTVSTSVFKGNGAQNGGFIILEGMRDHDQIKFRVADLKLEGVI